MDIIKIYVSGNFEILYIYLGDLLCVESPDPKRLHLPSPLDLRRKILIKAKRHMTSEDTGSLTNAAVMDSAAATVDAAGTVAMNSSAVYVFLSRFYPNSIQTLSRFLVNHFIQNTS